MSDNVQKVLELAPTSYDRYLIGAETQNEIHYIGC